MDHLVQRDVTDSTYEAEYYLAHDHTRDGRAVDDDAWYVITGQRTYADAERVAIDYAKTYRRVRVVRVDTVQERILVSEVHADDVEKAMQDAG